MMNIKDIFSSKAAHLAVCGTAFSIAYFFPQAPWAGVAVLCLSTRLAEFLPSARPRRNVTQPLPPVVEALPEQQAWRTPGGLTARGPSVHIERLRDAQLRYEAACRAGLLSDAGPHYLTSRNVLDILFPPGSLGQETRDLRGRQVMDALSRVTFTGPDGRRARFALTPPPAAPSPFQTQPMTMMAGR